ncbi:hypothetical protein BDP27DRAFT_1332050 [Rhodocollybia butyracea]|uniref:DUF6534 domain-containing protein n=1 Tax=Rhodocollybia butyracea TaxID=206335 RepID=A0A9P5PGT5_9AGAR|nr:hypothetical protein BDP27DRAFT_1332050 [Rhodocollybia butyracea]
MITSWGDPSALTAVPIERSVQGLITVLVAFIVQCFFTYRLYIFSRRLLFPIIFLPLIVGQLIAEAFSLQITFTTHNAQEFTAKSFINTSIASNSLPVAIDAGIATCMAYWLFKESKGAAGGSHAMIVRLITFTIISGFWTASVALAALVASIVSSVLTYGAISQLLCALYCNIVLANLNARDYLRDTQRSEIVLGSNVRFEAAPRSTITAGISFSTTRTSHCDPPSSEEHMLKEIQP